MHRLAYDSPMLRVHRGRANVGLEDVFKTADTTPCPPKSDGSSRILIADKLNATWYGHTAGTADAAAGAAYNADPCVHDHDINGDGVLASAYYGAYAAGYTTPPDPVPPPPAPEPPPAYEDPPALTDSAWSWVDPTLPAPSDTSSYPTPDTTSYPTPDTSTSTEPPPGDTTSTSSSTTKAPSDTSTSAKTTSDATSTTTSTNTPTTRARARRRARRRRPRPPRACHLQRPRLRRRASPRRPRPRQKRAGHRSP